MGPLLGVLITAGCPQRTKRQVSHRAGPVSRRGHAGAVPGKITLAFAGAKFNEAEPRYKRRLDKVSEIERLHR